MLILPQDPSCFLVELSDLEAEPPAAPIAGTIEPLRRIAGWARSYLCQPHAELGRAGPVCPYTPSSLQSGLFFLTFRRGRDLRAEDVVASLRTYRDWFLDLAPRDGSQALLKTILMLFPDLAAEDLPGLIEGTQSVLRPDYVARGLMIGEFHPGPPQKAGLWNPNFRPLYSPVPMLVIRHMVPTDFVFLREDPALVRSYLERYGREVPPRLAVQVRATARQYGLPYAEILAAAEPAASSGGSGGTAGGAPAPETAGSGGAR
jgi:hypothetical protein